MKLEIIDYEDLFDPEKLITSSEFIQKKKFDPDGLFSERIFGENSDNTDIDILGWIEFSGYKIISPTFFKRLEKCLKPKVLNKIISYNMKTDEKGNVVPNDDNLIEYQNTGLIGFQEKFEEIMEYYANKEVSEYSSVMKAYEEGKLFIRIFPVFSSKLRPGMIFAGSKEKGKQASIKFDDINGRYKFVIEHSLKIKEIQGDDDDPDKKLILYPMLYKLQEYCNEVTEYIIDNFLKEKKGILRRIIASARINFSSRNVLTPKANGKIDEVELPYRTFLELYRFLLINLIVKNEGISYNQAQIYFENCKRKFDKKMYKYMNELIKNSYKGLRILLNRNPSINIGSILLLQVTGVKSNFDDLTISISNNILNDMNADYDGDVLNIIALLSNAQKSYFENLKPSNLIISVNDTTFNRSYSLSKDSRVGYVVLNEGPDIEIEIDD